MKKFLACFAGLAASVGLASAGTIYDYRNTDINQRTDAGEINELRFIYDTDERLTFFANLSNSVSEAAWFVLSGGPNPKRSDSELAILYLDYEGGDVYAYRYNGLNNAASYQNSDAFITAYEDVLSVEDVGGTLSLSFTDLDVSALAAGTFGADWTGVAFDEQIGIWAHFAAVDAFSVDGGMVSEFRPSLQSWYDTSNATASVPEPAGLAIAGLLGVAGFAAWRRRRATA